jgi:glycosyltransferase involved in cell wall biosynthesis
VWMQPSSGFCPLILIPSYNSGQLLVPTVRSAIEFSCGCPVWVIIDGSTDGSDRELEQAGLSGVDIIRQEANAGKGSAVLLGVERAVAAGYSHVLTLDADGQHPAWQIPSVLERGSESPGACICGRPIFDDGAPKARIYGREISNFLAWWTSGFVLCADVLYGFRLYPAAALESAFRQTGRARRYDFDPEVLVRLSWMGIPAINFDSPVRYPKKSEGGISHFNYLRDNLLLAGMHARLLSLGLMRIFR